MIKARPVAGDLALGATFLEAIRPFVWRRGLDFAAVADIHAMKRRIDQHKGGALADAADPLARIAGHNVKLGEGGIREIEFLAQTLQLVWGGRDPALRVPTTLGALSMLVRAGHVPRNAAPRTGCRLSLPAPRRASAADDRRPPGARTAAAAGGAGPLRHVHGLRRRRRIRRRAAAPPAARCARATPRCSSWCRSCWHRLSRGWSWISAASTPRRRRPSPRCAALGFDNPERIVAAVRGWQAGHVRALRSARARELLAQLLPRMLAALARQPQPDTVFNRFDAFLARQPAGVQLLSLFQRNPGLLDRIAAVLGAAPSLANHLASHPAALDGLLSPEENPDPGPSAARPAAGRATARGRHRDHPPHRARGGFLRLGRHNGGPDRRRRGGTAPNRDRRCGAGVRCCRRCWRDFASRFGRVRGGSMAVVAMGKAGGREMMAGLRPRPDAGLRPPARR